MAKSRILFTDGVGAATLESDYPAPACRFVGWTPITAPQGEAGHAEETGARTMSRTSWRYGASFAIAGLGMGVASGSALDIADRLVGHLLNGGQCQVITEDVLSSSYDTCGLMPNTVPRIVLSDATNLEYTLSLSLINLDADPVPMSAYYGVSDHVIASGGTESLAVIDGVVYKLYDFTADGTFTVTRGGVLDAVLLIAGGGSGAGCNGTGLAGGGGGGGGVKRYRESLSNRIAVVPGAYPVVIGAGGAAPSATAKGNTGSNSTFAGETAHGGGGAGGGQFANRDALPGGSGGGGGSLNNTSGLKGAGTVGEGSDGANGKTGASGGADCRGGGGGGSGGAGVDGATAGTGGAGISDDITGTAVRYGAGGGGGSNSTPAGAAGTGGTGAGGLNAAGTAGTNGKGEGGGGAASTSGAKLGAAGGKGRLIIRVRLT